MSTVPQTRCAPARGSFRSGRRPRPAVVGFTLVELLVVVAIVGVLAGLLVPALASARRAAVRTRDLSAAGQLMAAFSLYSDDSRGAVLPGYVPAAMTQDSPAGGRAGLLVLDGSGNRITGIAAQRYLWRIAPYLDFNLAGLYKEPDVLREYESWSDAVYIVSLSPSMGMNSAFVGGDADRLGFSAAALGLYGSFYITRIEQPLFPDVLIAFASARGPGINPGEVVPGYFRVDAPARQVRVWSDEYDESDPPGMLGNVHPRYDGKAVTVQLDGHAAALSVERLDDMRRWSNRADSRDWLMRPR